MFTNIYFYVSQLVLKLNVELSYARLDLVKAFEDHSDVNFARKRVVWLEERIKKILESHWVSYFSSALIFNNKSLCHL